MPDANEIIKKMQFNHQRIEFAKKEKEIEYSTQVDT